MLHKTPPCYPYYIYIFLIKYTDTHFCNLVNPAFSLNSLLSGRIFIRVNRSFAASYEPRVVSHFPADSGETGGSGQECHHDSFICSSDGSCIPRSAVCDGRADCPHNEDETNCHRGKFRPPKSAPAIILRLLSSLRSSSALNLGPGERPLSLKYSEDGYRIFFPSPFLLSLPRPMVDSGIYSVRFSLRDVYS